MEDILASIRRILHEEDGKPAGEAAHAANEPDVLELDHTMMLPDADPPTPPHVSDIPPAVPLPPVVAPPVSVAIPPPPRMPDVPPTLAVPFPGQAELVAPEAAAAAAMSVGSLMRTLATERRTAVHRAGPTIEDLVREEIRPILKEWLDTHLPPLVERLVRAEIERVVSRTS
jgi:cell pole-organizing protein PopZ